MHEKHAICSFPANKNETHPDQKPSSKSHRVSEMVWSLMPEDHQWWEPFLLEMSLLFLHQEFDDRNQLIFELIKPFREGAFKIGNEKCPNAPPDDKTDQKTHGSLR